MDTLSDSLLRLFKTATAPTLTMFPPLAPPPTPSAPSPGNQIAPLPNWWRKCGCGLWFIPNVSPCLHTQRDLQQRAHLLLLQQTAIQVGGSRINSNSKWPSFHWFIHSVQNMWNLTKVFFLPTVMSTAASQAPLPTAHPCTGGTVDCNKYGWGLWLWMVIRGKC